MALLLVVLIMFFTSCATTVKVRHLIPATIDMSAYRNLAVQPVNPYRFSLSSTPPPFVPDMSGTCPIQVYSGFSSFFEHEVARRATNTLVQELEQTNYFSILTLGQADALAYERLKNMGYDGLVSAHIEDMEVDEYIFARQGEDTDGEQLRYYLKQRFSITISFSIIDLESRRTYAYRTYTDRNERTIPLDLEEDRAYFAPSLYTLAEPMVSSLVETFIGQLAPKWKTISVALMDNKPKNIYVERAWEEVKEGNLRLAREIFLQEWERSGHVPSGYNAALLDEALGEIEKAIVLMEQVWIASANEAAAKQLQRMRTSWEKHTEAQTQL